MADSVAQFAAKMDRAAKGIETANLKAVTEAAAMAKRTMLAAAATAGLKPGQRMRGVGKRGAAWGVGYTVTGGTTEPRAYIAFRGPVHLVESDTKPHPIYAGARRTQVRAEGAALIGALTGKKVRKAKARTGQALATPFGPRASVKSPGTRGKHFFEPAKVAIVAEAPAIVARAQTESLVKSGLGR